MAGYHTFACDHERQCGGCQLLAMPYELQLKRKQREIEELFEPYLPNVALEPIAGMDDPRAFRNKVIAPFAPKRTKRPERTQRTRGNKRPATQMVHGMFAEHSHRIIPIESCLVEDPKARPIIAAIARLAERWGIEAYDEDRGTGLLRHVVVRTSRTTGEVMVTLVLTSRDLPGRKSFIKELTSRCRDISTIVININPRDTNVVLGDHETVVFGRGYIVDELCGCKFKISSQSFFQTNPQQTEVLYSKAVEMAGLTGRERVLDAYCGIGTIGLIASQHAAEVVGVERNASAVHDAKANARLNEIEHAHFVVADSSRWALAAADAGERFDVAFMDPPRAGSSEEFLRALATLGPRRIVYISCGPTTQRRDIDLLSKLGYRLVSLAPVDMFPHTEHVENIALLTRAGM